AGGLFPPAAVMCAVSRATYGAYASETRLVTTRALALVAATECYGLSSSGWWVTSRSAPAAAASATTSSVGSMANSTRSTGATGSPTTRPTASQGSAVAGG